MANPSIRLLVPSGNVAHVRGASLPAALDDSMRQTDACFIVRDKNGQALGYFYFEDEPGRCSAAKLLTKDEARRMAANFAKLPELLRKRG